MAKKTKAKSSIAEQLQRMTKAELLQLLKEGLLWFHIREDHIKAARANVLRNRAKEAFKQYQDFQVDLPGQAAGHLEWAEFYKRQAERDALWDKYNKYWDKADKIQFGENAKYATK